MSLDPEFDLISLDLGNHDLDWAIPEQYIDRQPPVHARRGLDTDDLPGLPGQDQQTALLFLMI